MTPTNPDERRRYVSLPYKPKPTERVVEIRKYADRGRVEVIVAVELPQSPSGGKIHAEGA